MNADVVVMIIFTQCDFFTQVLISDFHWSPSNSNSSQVFKIPLSIQADFRTAVVRMVSILPLISGSSSHFSRFLETVQRAPTTICVTFMFLNFFNSLARFMYLSSILPYLTFPLWSAGTAKSTK